MSECGGPNNCAICKEAARVLSTPPWSGMFDHLENDYSPGSIHKRYILKLTELTELDNTKGETS